MKYFVRQARAKPYMPRWTAVYRHSGAGWQLLSWDLHNEPETSLSPEWVDAISGSVTCVGYGALEAFERLSDLDTIGLRRLFSLSM